MKDIRSNSFIYGTWDTCSEGVSSLDLSLSCEFREKIWRGEENGFFLAGCRLRRQNNFPLIRTSEPVRRLRRLTWNSYFTYDQRTVSSVFKTSVRFSRDIRESDQGLIWALQEKVLGVAKSLRLGEENHFLMKWVKGSQLTNQTPPQGPF